MNITKYPDSSPRAALGAWEPVEYFSVAGETLAVGRRGAGDPLVCLHAVGHGARDFEPLAERVASTVEVIAVDWPGHGKSADSSVPVSASRYADVLETLLPRLTDRPSILLGCSIGGAAAIALAARRPDLVRALVLCNPGGLIAIDGMTRFFTARMSRFFAAGACGAAWFPRAFAAYYRFVLPREPATAQRNRIVAAGRESAGVLAQAWSSFGEARADLRPLIPGLRLPTYFAWAKDDRLIAWRRNRAAVESFPHHRVELFPGGHAAFLEDPDRFADGLRRFLATLADCTDEGRPETSM